MNIKTIVKIISLSLLIFKIVSPINASDVVSSEPQNASIIPSALPVINYELINNNARLSWQSVTVCNKYIIFRSDKPDSDFTEIASTVQLSYTDENLPSGTIYYYKVKSRSENSAESEFSAVLSVMIPVDIPVVTASNDSAEKIILKWNPVNAASKYTVYRSLSLESSGESLAVTQYTIYEDTSAEHGKIYFYSVVAASEKNIQSKSSAPVKAWLEPAAPVIKISNENFDALLLEWNNIAGADKYSIYRAEGSENFYLLTSVNSNSYIDKNIKPGIVYKYKINASFLDITGKDSNIVSSSVAKSASGLFARSFVPGWGQYYQGREKQGLIYGSAFTVSAITTCALIYYQNKTWNDYSQMPYGTPESEFDKKYNAYKYTTYSLWGAAFIAASVYILNWVDIYYLNAKPGKDLNYSSSDNFMNSIGFNISAIQYSNDPVYNLSLNFRF